MRRQRLTWQQRGGADRRASAHPAYPDEGPASPAYKPDPEADAYENGDTSSWAEDPHPGPYPNSAHPAYPDEGPASPAYKAASLERALEKKAARCLRLASALMGPGAPQMAVEDQALSLMDLSDRAINASLARLAGDEPSEEEAEEAAPEKAEAKKKARTIKALLRMIADEDEDEADEDAEEDAEEVEEADEEVVVESKKKASFRRFSKKADDAEKAVEEAEDAADVVEGTKEEAKKKAALRRLARAVRVAEAKVEGAEEAEDKGEGDKKASRRLAKIRRDFNEVRRAFRRLAADDGNEDENGDEAEEAPEAKKASSRRRAYGWAMTPHMGDDAALAEMLQQEGMEGGVDPTEAMGFVAEDHDHDPEAEAMLAQLMAETEAPAAPAEAMYAEDVPMDPLGVLADDDMGLTDDDYMLASLFGKSAAKDEAEEAPSKEEAEDAPADEGKKEEAAKKASRLRPQPKTASTGATRLGGGVIGKAAASEVTELSALWESAPDVSKFF